MSMPQLRPGTLGAMLIPALRTSDDARFRAALSNALVGLRGEPAERASGDVIDLEACKREMMAALEWAKRNRDRWMGPHCNALLRSDVAAQGGGGASDDVRSDARVRDLSAGGRPETAARENGAAGASTDGGEALDGDHAATVASSSRPEGMPGAESVEGLGAADARTPGSNVIEEEPLTVNDDDASSPVEALPLEPEAHKQTAIIVAPARALTKRATRTRSARLVATPAHFADRQPPPAWTSIDRAAVFLDVGAVRLRRAIERNARRMDDGQIVAEVDGIVARKLGRTWRVCLGPGWAEAR